jgi:hypothetical protein
MSINELSLKISFNDYPMLKSLKKKDAEKLIIDIFNTGYKAHFPNKELLNKNQDFEEIRVSIDTLKDKIIDSDLLSIGDIIVSKINEQIQPLNTSLNKLLGLQTASAKKGEIGENIIQNAFTTRYGDITYEDKSGVAHSGDAWICLQNNEKIMIESKNYTSTVGKSEIEKMEYDMKMTHIKFCLFLSLNKSVQGFKEMDIHSFVHNGENYFAIIVSNITNDIYKIDLAFSMIRKLMDLLNTPEKFPWIVKRLQENLDKVNEITVKNYQLRDNFYSMEKAIQSSMDTHHKVIRDYQYEMEELVKHLTNEISETLSNSLEKNKSIKDLMIIHKDKKIYPVVSHISDIMEKKKWQLKEIGTNKYDLLNKCDKVGSFEITLKKASININKIDLIFESGNNKQNMQNLKILEANF